MTLTPTQKDVIRRMREGAELWHYHVMGWTPHKDDWFAIEGKHIQRRTFDALCRKKIIVFEHSLNDHDDFYTLTDLGKTIELE